jgi:hypothetical protein
MFIFNIANDRKQEKTTEKFKLDPCQIGLGHISLIGRLLDSAQR